MACSYSGLVVALYSIVFSLFPLSSSQHHDSITTAVIHFWIDISATLYFYEDHYAESASVSHVA